MNPPLAIALAGSLFYLLLIAVLLRYAALHYTRVPGGRWTVWEKTVTSAPSGVGEEERAA